MKAAILSIGDELVLGQTVDTNSAYLSRELAAIGCDTALHVTVGDDAPGIERAIREAVVLADLIVITGGLGPTADDLTRNAIAAALGDAPLELRSEWLDQVKSYFARLNRVMPEQNAIQAMLPRGSKVIWNPVGTACGIEATLEHKYDRMKPSRQVPLYAMPGVPKEMKAMFAATVGPAIAERAGGAVILSRTLHTFGVGESTIAEKLGPLMNRDRNPSVGTTVSGGVVSLRLNARFPNRADAESQLNVTESECRMALGSLIYGRDADTLPSVVGALLKEKEQTIATAESCTGGLIAKSLTDIPGSSAYVAFGWVTYADEAKVAMLDVSPQTIAHQGAVSEATVTEMGRNARLRSGADIAIAVSGVAGPDGGTTDKPVGTVWIALASAEPGTSDPAKSIVVARKFHFPGDREWVRERATKMSLALVRYQLTGEPAPF